MDNLTIIVTGGCGFIGTNLVRKLSTYENTNIIVIDNFWRGSKEYIQNLKNVDIIDADLSNYDLCCKYIKNADLVYHLVRQTL